jgi:hypothetical protein
LPESNHYVGDEKIAKKSAYDFETPKTNKDQMKLSQYDQKSQPYRAAPKVEMREM